jgi:hypothetical protein
MTELHFHCVNHIQEGINYKALAANADSLELLNIHNKARNILTALEYPIIIYISFHFCGLICDLVSRIDCMRSKGLEVGET